MKLQQLLQQPGIWRGRGRPSREDGTPPLATGCTALDARLPTQGWPPGALSEILCSRAGAGELSLVLPALRELVARGRHIVLVTPPYVPYPPALARSGLAPEALVLVEAPAKDALWAAEQALRSGACGAVLCWLDPVNDRSLRRLQLAAEQGRCHGFLFRPARSARHASPAALRLQLRPWGQLSLLKCRGSFARAETYRLEAEKGSGTFSGGKCT